LNNTIVALGGIQFTEMVVEPQTLSKMGLRSLGILAVEKSAMQGCPIVDIVE